MHWKEREDIRAVFRAQAEARVAEANERALEHMREVKRQDETHKERASARAMVARSAQAASMNQMWLKEAVLNEAPRRQL